MKKWILLCSLFAVISVASDAEAFRLFRRRSSGNNYSSQANVGGTYQAQAQYKANLMASRGVMSHGVSALVGSFEGIGCGSSRNCSTCVPKRGMTLVADAAAYGNGRWYRVRAWR